MKLAASWAWGWFLYWLKNNAISLDQFCNTFFLFGSADETISARCWRLRRYRAWSAARRVIDCIALLFNDKDHCEASYRSEVLRLQSPPEVREESFS